MSSAKYTYKLKADSGYQSDMSGPITPERHAVACAVFSGLLSDEISALNAAPDLLADLIDAAAQLRTYEALHRAKGTEDSTAKAEVNAALAARFEATIARARGEA